MGHSSDKGNTLTKVVGSNTTTYAWDFENRMTSVTLPGSGGTVSFKYDPFGRRIYKSSSAGTSIYAYDGDNLVEETNSSGAVVARYGRTEIIDEPLAMLRSGATSFYQADGLGTITSLANTSGSLAQTYTFDSFGNQTATSGSLTNSFRYTAREFDSETSLYYYRARYYDSTTGRFLSEDPIRWIGGINFFTYVHNRPINLVDSTGLDSTCPNWVPDWVCKLLGSKKQPQNPPLKTCVCTRTSRTPQPSRPGGLLKVCVYSCDCTGKQPVVILLRSIQRLQDCKDIDFCPFQIAADIDTSGSTPRATPDTGFAPILEPPKP